MLLKIWRLLADSIGFLLRVHSVPLFLL